MNSCFIIMPLTTPEPLVPIYGKDPDHFAHVLAHLFVPALKSANFEPILPIAKGADMIHAEIVRNLETADLVLCDISALNPNVFFELGCRTALNKPVCYVMDDLTHTIPFDTAIINHHTYKHTLAPWTLEAETALLSAHIRASADRSAGKNTLWQYFGLQSVARAAKTGGDQQDSVAYLVMQVDAIKKRLEEQQASATTSWGVTGWGEAKPYEMTSLSSLLTPLPRDWDEVIKDSESDLAQIKRLQNPNKTRVDIKSVRATIEGHISALGELIGAEPDTQRATKARELQLRFRDVLSGK